MFTIGTRYIVEFISESRSKLWAVTLNNVRSLNIRYLSKSKSDLNPVECLNISESKSDKKIFLDLNPIQFLNQMLVFSYATSVFLERFDQTSYPKSKWDMLILYSILTTNHKKENLLSISKSTYWDSKAIRCIFLFCVYIFMHEYIDI